MEVEVKIPKKHVILFFLLKGVVFVWATPYTDFFIEPYPKLDGDYPHENGLIFVHPVLKWIKFQIRIIIIMLLPQNVKLYLSNLL